MKKSNLISSLFLVLAITFPTAFVFAQDFGTAAVNTGLGGILTSDDPRVLIGRIIQIILSLLGVIILGLIIYAGFLWMTSEGDEDKIRQAKKIITNAAIGLAITLSAWAITTFVLNKLFGAISGGGNTQIPITNNIVPSNSGFGAMGSCTVDTVYPASNQNDVARNTSLIVTFKDEIELNSACVNASGSACACDNTTSCSLINERAFRIYKKDLGDACLSGTCPAENTNTTDVTLTVSSDRKILILTPLSFLGTENSNTLYEVKITNSLKKGDGTDMFRTCSSPELQWGFEVNTKMDLTPPQVIAGYLFPQPDNAKDLSALSSPARAAEGTILINTCPRFHASAVVTEVTPTAEVTLNYHGLINTFRVVVPAGEPNKAQLFNGSTNALLGIADFNNDNQVIFNNYFTLKTTSHNVGESWVIKINPEVLADTLTVANETYTFSKTNENNNILVPEPCTADQQALRIREKVSGNSAVNMNLLGNRITLQTKVAGLNGNGLTLSTSNRTALTVTQFSGGADSSSNNTQNGKKDSPMNSIIKINFNEAINPITLSGTAQELSSYIRVVNASTTSRLNGATCSSNENCRSYKCENSTCVGDYVNGHYMVSGGYKTVEFISDNECGINGCGEKIYCLPANSNLAVEFNAANLRQCTSDNDCLALAPYRSCSLGLLGYRTCQDTNFRNYPQANITNLGGVIDVAFNSLDGNRDSLADGPLRYFSDNYPAIVDNKDSYRFSFFINDLINTTPPSITSMLPDSTQTDINLANPVKVVFSTLMMSDTLRSGGKKVSSGTETVEHKFINLRSTEPSPLGFWVDSVSEDSGTLDGIADITTATINHSPFLESFTYNTQVGSGVKDIFQNCFKPSIGPGCIATLDSPSCCFGVATSTLTGGNCN